MQRPQDTARAHASRPGSVSPAATTAGDEPLPVLVGAGLVAAGAVAALWLTQTKTGRAVVRGVASWLRKELERELEAHR